MQTLTQFKYLVAKMLNTNSHNKVFISIKAKSGTTNLTTATKNSIVQSLKNYSVASVTPEIVDPETTLYYN